MTKVWFYSYNRNTKKATGYYYTSKFMMNLIEKRSTKKYHVELKNNKIVLLDKVEDPKSQK